MNDLKSQARLSHPRPDFFRENWQVLDGTWDFAFDDDDHGLLERWQDNPDCLTTTIQVPFCYQSIRSGIADKQYHPVMWYHREFHLNQKLMNQRRILLHFGAVDYSCCVWLNGMQIGNHHGGYTPFLFDITPYVHKADKNTLVLRVEDRRDAVQPRGKQYWEDGLAGCWYTPVSGIWQSVYLEGVGRTAIKNIFVTPDIDHYCVKIAVELDCTPNIGLSLTCQINHDGRLVRRIVSSIPFKRYELTIDMRDSNRVDSLRLWSPSHPDLYDLVIQILDKDILIDEVYSYFGLRKISIKDGRILLNNQLFYQRLILDQGYWPDSLLTPPDNAAIEKDVRLIRSLGFNGVRMHQKIEDPRFYYWCDRLGVLCWGELPAAYEYSPEMVTNLSNTLSEFIQRDYNHPSIICWVPLNESWGVREIYANSQQQQLSVMLYYLCKALDPIRLVSSNDGWEQTITDIIALHDYSETAEKIIIHFENPYDKERQGLAASRMSFAEGYMPDPNAAMMLTEYGGIAMRNGDQQEILENMETWGYHGKVDSPEAYVSRYRELTDAIRSLPNCSGYCYTQLNDVMQEVNGLVTPDRTPKIDPSIISAINVNPPGWCE